MILTELVTHFSVFNLLALDDCSLYLLLCLNPFVIGMSIRPVLVNHFDGRM